MIYDEDDDENPIVKLKEMMEEMIGQGMARKIEMQVNMRDLEEPLIALHETILNKKKN